MFNNWRNGIRLSNYCDFTTFKIKSYLCKYVASLKTALFSSRETCFTENSCQVEQAKSCAKSLRFERKGGEVPEGLPHAEGLQLVRPVVIPEEATLSLLPKVKSGNRQSSLIVPARACKILKPRHTAGLPPAQ